MKKRVGYTVLIEVLEPHEMEMVSAYKAHDFIKMNEERKRYLSLLSRAGWTEEEFNNEMLNRIDHSWDIIPTPRGGHPAFSISFGKAMKNSHCKSVLH